MERCTLCGGKLVKGKCTECGLDNTKNDKRYRLNTHGEKDTVFQHDKCEDNLNKEKERKAATPAATVRSNAQRQKQLAQRRSTGTAKKRRGGVIRWIVILVILFEVFGNLIMNKVEELQYSASDSLGEVIRSITGYEEDTVPEKPEEILWNEDSQGYFEQGLAPGFYTIGYEIPAGTYQLYCLEETVWCWYEDPYGDREYYTLYSTDRQESYAESFGECGYYELSGELTFEEGGILCVEDGDEGVLIKGEGEGKASLESRVPQHLYETVTACDGMTVGKDVQPGVYDIEMEVPEGEYGSAYLTITGPDDDTFYISLHEATPVFYRMELTKGSTVELTKYGTDESHVEVHLVPSY